MLFPIRVWKDIKGYEGLYQVSNFGRVRNKETKKEKDKTRNEGEVLSFK